MNGIRFFTAVVLLLAFAMVSQVCADQAGVLGKLSEAAKAEKAADASAAVTAAVAAVEKDIAGSGDYGEAVGKAVVRKLKDLAESYAREAKGTEVGAQVTEARVKDLYGALLPVAKGDMAAPAAHLKTLSAAAPAPAKAMIDAAVAALAGPDKTKAVNSVKVALTVAYLGKAYALCGEKNYRQAGQWVNEAADYLKTEGGASSERKADIGDASAVLRGEVLDLSKNIPVDPEQIAGLMKEVEGSLLGPEAKTK